MNERRHYTVPVYYYVHGPFILDLNLSKSALILGRLPLHVKNKYENKIKTKQGKIFAILYCQFSLVKSC